MAAGDPRHAPRMDGGAPVLGAGALAARFSARGAHLALGGHEVTLAAAGIRRGGGGRHALTASASPTIAGPEVRPARGARVVEWWRSLPSGLEHGLTIDEQPARRLVGELTRDAPIAACDGDRIAHPHSRVSIILTLGRRPRSTIRP